MTATGRSETLARLLPYVERARGFSGWDLSLIRERNLDGPVPWDYEAIASEHARPGTSVVDFGTGGGEVLTRIAASSAARFVATEAWGVNAAVAHERLRPRIPLVHCDSERPPFRAVSFDLVLSRHEAIAPAEVDRVLRPRGTFLTQQVVPDTWPELRDFFPRATVFPDHYREYAGWFERHSYELALRRHDYRVAWDTLGDVALHLLIAPWTLPDFDIERDLDALIALEAALTTPEGIVMHDGRYLLEARKPS
jgi:SAM-dependent methyltransferase